MSAQKSNPPQFRLQIVGDEHGLPYGVLTGPGGVVVNSCLTAEGAPSEVGIVVKAKDYVARIPGATLAILR